MDALKRINGLTLAHLDAVRLAALRETAHIVALRLHEVAAAIAPYIARAEMDTEAQSGEAA